MGLYNKGDTQGLFEGLGIRKWTWKKDPRWSVCTFSGVSLLAADLAKFGLLMLNKGMFNEGQLLSRQWCILPTAPSSRPRPSTVFVVFTVSSRALRLAARDFFTQMVVRSTSRDCTKRKMVAVRLHRQNAEGGEDENSRSNFIEFLELIESQPIVLREFVRLGKKRIGF